MKQPYLVITPMLLFHVALAMAVPDHLTPVDVNEDPKYRAILVAKLCPTPFDCGRIVFKPPFRYGEESISIYSKATSGNNQRYYVTYVRAADSLRDRSDAGHLPERANTVEVRRVDLEIPAQTARLLKQVWTRMLSGRQTPRQSQDESETFYGDATIAEFSIESNAGNVLYGETIIVPELGPKTKQLLKIARMLVTYCTTNPSERGAISREINRNAAQFLHLLES